METRVPAVNHAKAMATTKSEGRREKCEDCGLDVADLVLHRKTVHGANVVKCGACDLFVIDINAHRQTFHASKSSFTVQCDECNMIVSNLIVHKQKAHQLRRRLQASKKLGSEVRKTKAASAEEMRRAKGIISCTCTFCEEIFASPEKTAEHERKHTLGFLQGKKTLDALTPTSHLICTQCNQIFNNHQELAKHRRAEHRNWRCLQCGQTFFQKPGILNHIRIFHR